jgi:predicted HTH transcriptional regulator
LAVTIFGPPWVELELEHVRSYLKEVDDESLVWEAKSTKLDKKAIRRQVCAFANSHEGGYLILGAEQVPGEGWKLDGLPFPDEATTWLTNVIDDPEHGVRPRPSFDIRVWPTEDGHVAVLHITPTSRPRA